MRHRGTIERLTAIFRRELGIFSRRPIFLFCMIVMPVVCVVFFTSLMRAGLPTGLPMGLVDEDRTHITRILARTMEAFEASDFADQYDSFSEARKAVQRGEIYGFFYIPKGTTEKAMASKHRRFLHNGDFVINSKIRA